MKPNVLVVIADQLRADHVGFMGNPVVQTPHLDAIANGGRVFENAWVSNPVCMPNRCSMMTGRMPTAHGVIFNDRTLDWQANTFVRRFREQGYRTGLLGKSHLQHGMSKNSVVPFRGEAVQSSVNPVGWDQIEDFERYLDSTPPDPEDFYGFDHIRLAIDHGARVTGHHLQWALEKGAAREDLFVEYDAQSPGSRRSEDWWQIYQPPYDEKFHSTRFVAEETQRFIREAHAEEKPWLAWCSFPDPHHPMTPPGKWFDRHRPEDMVLPGSRNDSLQDAPAHLRNFKKIHPAQQRDWVSPCGFGTDRLLQQAIAATYGMVEMVDDSVGQVLALLDELAISDNTIVVFTSDHGDMMGDHGLFLKGFMHYRGTLQMPMVFKVPNGVPGKTSSLGSSIDLAPTLMDLCKIPAFDGVQGKSLVPIIDDAQASVRDYVLVEDDIAAITAKLTPIPGKTRTLITETHRYTRNSKGEEQLFDLQTDPDEMSDIKQTQPVARSAALEAMTDALIEADDVARGAPVTNNSRRDDRASTLT
jgi:arylsulfatase A-like enzyme